MRRSMMLGIVIGVFLLTPLLAPLIADAHGGVLGVIHGCVQQGSLQVRIVGPDDACRDVETAIHWSIIGPQGPAGPQGQSGPPGPQRYNIVDGADLRAAMRRTQQYLDTLPSEK